MRAKFSSLIVIAMAFAGPAFAQTASTMPLETLATSAEVQAAIAKAQADRKGNAAQANEPLAYVPPYRVNLEYRFIQNLPSIHDTEDEIFYIVDGSGIITVGGTLVGAKRTNATNQGGSAIQNGTQVHLSKGDIYIVPQNTPHMLTPVGGPLIDLSLHVPGSPK